MNMLFRSVDVSGDGCIERVEWEILLDKLFGETWKWKEALQKKIGEGPLTKKKLMNIFDEIDSDGDASGDIDITELVRGLKKAGLNMTDYETSKLFQAADEDGDG